MEEDKKEEKLFDVPDEMDSVVNEEEFTKALDKMSVTDRQIFEDTGVIHIDRDMPAETQTMHVVHLSRVHQEKRNNVFRMIIALLVAGVAISSIGILLNRFMRGKNAGEEKKENESYIKINEAAFPDVSFRNYVLTRLDTDGDGMLSNEERNSVMVLIVPEEKAITSLKGIEQFPHLQSLTAKNTGITELDLSMVTELSYLDVSGTEISELDLEKNTDLLDVHADNTASLQKVYFPSESEIRTFDSENSAVTCEKNTDGYYIGCTLK